MHPIKKRCLTLSSEKAKSGDQEIKRCSKGSQQDIRHAKSVSILEHIHNIAANGTIYEGNEKDQKLLDAIPVNSKMTEELSSKRNRSQTGKGTSTKRRKANDLDLVYHKRIL